MNSPLKISAIGITVLALFGCGGGGGGSGGTTPTADITITSGNAVAVARDVYDSVGDTASLGDFGTGGLIGSTGPATPTLSKAASSLAAKAGLSGSVDTGSLIAVAFGPEQSACAVAGTVRISGDISNPDALSGGDTVTLVFTNCDDGDGQVVNGRLTLTIDSVSGDMTTQFFALGATLDFQSFSVREAANTTTVNGGFSMLLDTTGYPVTEAALSSPYLSVTDGVRTATLSNYSTMATVDESSQPPAFSVTSSGRIDLPARGGSVSYSTPEPFAGFGEGDPDSGVLFVRGASGATITMTVQSSTQVQLEMDYDGNGTVDETVILTWVEFGS
jgi:hypothetical protein